MACKQFWFWMLRTFCYRLNCVNAIALKHHCFGLKCAPFSSDVPVFFGSAFSVVFGFRIHFLVSLLSCTQIAPGFLSQWETNWWKFTISVSHSLSFNFALYAACIRSLHNVPIYCAQYTKHALKLKLLIYRNQPITKRSTDDYKVIATNRILLKQTRIKSGNSAELRQTLMTNFYSAWK